MSATLNDIRLKVRRVTKSPSQNQLTDPQIDQYINTFYLYDFPEHLRLFDLRDHLKFVCSPNIDQYPLPTGAVASLAGALGIISGNMVQINIFPILGLPNDVIIQPGTVVVTATTTNGTSFSDATTRDGTLLPDATGDGLNSIIDYQTGQLSLNFNYATVAVGVSITFSYTLPDYVTITPPLYIAGYESFYTQSESEMFRLYPKLRNITALTYGGGGSGIFSGFLAAVPVLRNNVLINTLDTSNRPMNLQDDGLGNLVGDGTGTIDYVTGVISGTFNNNILSGQVVNSQTVPYVASRPTAALFYQNIMTLRPVPDQAYNIEIEAYKRPTALLATNQQPLLREWWQFLAMGAALKVFEDRGDLKSYGEYRPIFDEYRRLAERKTIVQYTSDRTATIYTEQLNGGFGQRIGNF